MSTLVVEYSSPGTPSANVRRGVEAALVSVAKRYGRDDIGPVTWVQPLQHVDEHTARLTLRVGPADLKVDVRVGPEHVRLRCDLPLVARPFRSRIERETLAALTLHVR